jgi:hypothetical protein
LEDIVVGFTGFLRKQEEADSGTNGTANGLSSGFKPLLPVKGGEGETNTNVGVKSTKKSTHATNITVHQPQHHTSPSTSSPPSPRPLYFHPRSSNLIPPTESFERTAIQSSLSSTVAPDPLAQFHHHDDINMNRHHQAPTYEHSMHSTFTRHDAASMGSDGWPASSSTHARDAEHSSFMANFTFDTDIHSAAGPVRNGVDSEEMAGGAMMDSEMDSDLLGILPRETEHPSPCYTGSYWLVPFHPCLCADNYHNRQANRKCPPRPARFTHGHPGWPFILHIKYTYR